jgi:hypothetical protein
MFATKRTFCASLVKGARKWSRLGIGHSRVLPSVFRPRLKPGTEPPFRPLGGLPSRPTPAAVRCK